MSAYQPSAPTPPSGQPPVRVHEPAPPSRPPTLALILIGLIVVCLSCSIVGLAGLAGYNDGAREVERIERVTREADINRQVELALTDVAGGNRDLAALRLEHVVITLGANHAQAQALLTEVRAVTATPTPSPTPTVTPTLPDTPTPAATATAGPPPLDPDALFSEAQAASVGRDFRRTIEVLNILRSLDPDYRKAEVEQLLHTALTTLSLQYLRAPDTTNLAEGILLARQAQAIAPIGDLSYEAYIAGRYMDGLAADGMECLLSVREWQSVYDEAPQYRDVYEHLGRAYARCGDAYTYQTEYCPAAQYYRWALQIITDASVSAKLSTAYQMCAQATPTPTPTIEGVPAEGQPTPPPA